MTSLTRGAPRPVEVEVLRAGSPASGGTVPYGMATIQFEDADGVFTYTAEVGTVRRMLEFALRELDR